MACCMRLLYQSSAQSASASNQYSDLFEMRLPVRPPSRPIVVSPSDAAILSLALRLLQAKALRASASSKVSNCYGIKRLT